MWDIAISADPQQTYMYVGDGENELIHVLKRDTLEELTAVGDGGRGARWRGVSDRWAVVGEHGPRVRGENPEGGMLGPAAPANPAGRRSSNH